MCIVPEHQFKYIVPVNYSYLKYSSHVEYICSNILGLMGYLLWKVCRNLKKNVFYSEKRDYKVTCRSLNLAFFA